MARQPLESAEQLRLLDLALVEAALPGGGVMAEQSELAVERGDPRLALLHVASGRDAVLTRRVKLGGEFLGRRIGRPCRRRKQYRERNGSPPARDDECQRPILR